MTEGWVNDWYENGDSFTPQIVFEHLWCARSWGYNSKEDKIPHEAYLPKGKTQINK